MKGDKDIDIFVLFPEDTDRKELEERGLSVGKKVFEEFGGSYEVDYAEHPYTKGRVEGHEVEIVPCFDVEPDSIQSAVDRSPHHSNWVSKSLDEELRKDVVLLKEFLEVEGIYGSSLRVEGFSGYLCEVLIIEFGGFKELLDSAGDWSKGEFIDPEDHHTEGIPDKLKERFKNDSFIVIDPVDSERNVASVLSEENFARFVYRCWQFVENPGIDYFREEKYDFTEFELKKEVQSRADFIVVEFERPEAVDDLVYPQMRKLMRLLRRKLEERDFRIFESGFHSFNGKIRFFFELGESLPEVELLEGPKVFHNSKHLSEFTGKYENTFVRGDRLFSKMEREYTSAKKFLREFLDRESEVLKEHGVPDHLADKMVEHRFADPIDGEEEWLNYLAEKLRV